MGDIRLMKYKVGQKVIIKTWKEMEKEFGCRKCQNKSIIINCHHGFLKAREDILNKYFPDRILKIKKVEKEYYTMEGKLCGYSTWWTDDMIKYKYLEPIPIEDPILTRWEILDL